MKREYIVEIESQYPLGQKELVRCKDCEFRRNLLFPLKSGETIECNGRYHKPDWFCGDGKRMEQTE